MSERSSQIVFRYDDGRAKTISLEEAAKFTRNSVMLSDDAQKIFRSFRLRAEGLLEQVAQT